jgi:hypothetical protein
MGDLRRGQQKSSPTGASEALAISVPRRDPDVMADDDKNVERRLEALEGVVGRMAGLGAAALAIFVTERLSKKWFPTDGSWSWNEALFGVVFVVCFGPSPALPGDRTFH